VREFPSLVPRWSLGTRRRGATLTEAEWLACEDPQKMLEFLQRRASGRRFRLLACACCRGKRYPACPRGKAAVAVAEDVADGRASEGVREDTHRMMQSLLPEDDTWSAYSLIVWALHREGCTSYPQGYVMSFAIPCAVEAGLTSREELLSLIFDIFGNPFHPVSPGPWVTPAAVSVAQDIYDRRDFATLPVLADLLEEAGCPHQSVLDHCRQPGEHARGCWVVDLVLGKS
jgi:hypothetical protein